MGRKGKLRVLVLGAGFGGLEIAAKLSDAIGENLELTLVDKNDHFFFGYSKIDVMFGRQSAASVKHSYDKISLPGVKFVQENILAIDPHGKKIRTDKGSYKADVLVVALGADYDLAATPGLVEGGDEFYTFSGAEKLRKKLATFDKGHALVAVTGFPFKCPPAPSEVALLLDEYLRLKGVRQNCKISLVLPFELPIPPSYGISKALLKAFKNKDITYIPEMMVWAINPASSVAELDDGDEIPFDLFLGIPEHKVPGVVKESGLVDDEWVPVDRDNLRTSFPNVYAIGDLTSVGTPKAGMFAMGAARTAAESIIAEFRGEIYTGSFSGADSCYVEFGGGKVARADVDFFSGPAPTGKHYKASGRLAKEKLALEEKHLARWFRS